MLGNNFQESCTEEFPFFFKEMVPKTCVQQVGKQRGRHLPTEKVLKRKATKKKYLNKLSDKKKLKLQNYTKKTHKSCQQKIANLLFMYNQAREDGTTTIQTGVGKSATVAAEKLFLQIMFMLEQYFF